MYLVVEIMRVNVLRRREREEGGKKCWRWERRVEEERRGKERSSLGQGHIWWKEDKKEPGKERGGTSRDEAEQFKVTVRVSEKRATAVCSISLLLPG
jgi:hypothetical protein